MLLKFNKSYSPNNHSQDLYQKKCAYWANGQIIGEGVIDTQNASNNTDFSVRYFYSGNQKIAMERRDMSTGQTSLYYFINNAQGTPVLILDSSGQTKSRINLDEWGNLGMLQGPSQEINYTGKKLDVSTGLYYFNQRYYDPEIGRFLQEDPAGQGLNPYRYCGNNPLMYTDPDGQYDIWNVLLGNNVSVTNHSIGVSFENARLGYDWSNGSFRAGFGVGNSFGSGVGLISFGTDIWAGYDYDSNDGSVYFSTNAGVGVDSFGCHAGYGIQYSKRLSTVFDYIALPTGGSASFSSNSRFDSYKFARSIGLNPQVSGPSIQWLSLPRTGRINFNTPQFAVGNPFKHPIFGDLKSSIKVPEQLPKPYSQELQEMEDFIKANGWKKASRFLMKMLELFDNGMMLIIPIDTENIIEAAGMNRLTKNTLKLNLHDQFLLKSKENHEVSL